MIGSDGRVAARLEGAFGIDEFRAAIERGAQSDVARRRPLAVAASATHRPLEPAEALVPRRRRLVQPRARGPQRAGPQAVAHLAPGAAGARSTRPASSSAARCLATAWRVIGSAAVSAGTVVEPSRTSVSTTWRRVGSASAAKTGPIGSLSQAYASAKRRRQRGQRERRLGLHDDDARAGRRGDDEQLDARRRLVVAPPPPDEPVRLLGRLDVDLALGLVLEPLLAALLGRERLPDLLGGRLDLDLAARAHGGSFDNRLVAIVV